LKLDLTFARSAGQGAGFTGKVILADFFSTADTAMLAFAFGVGASADGAILKRADGWGITEVVAEFFGSLEALAGIFGERFEDDGGQGRRDFGLELAWIGRGFFDMGFVNGVGIALKGEAIGEDFKDTDAERVDIGLCGGFAAE
jgi:hypothetical protein